MFKRLLLFIVMQNLLLLFLPAQNVGIGTTLPKAKLHVADSAVLFSGPASLVFNHPPPISGPGIRMMWYPQKGAFRVGSVSTDFWDQVNVGWNSFAAGSNTMSSGQSSTSMGEYNIASGYGATSMGTNNVANGYSSTSMGGFTWANGDYSTTMGRQTAAQGVSSTAIGWGTVANSDNSLAVGMYNDNTGGAANRIFEIGIGTTEIRKNAFTVLTQGNVGVGTISPTARLHVADSSVLFSGPVTLPANTVYPPPVSGPGIRMMWYPQKAAFRAGSVNNNGWDKDNIGLNSFASGQNTKAVGESATSMGAYNTASGNASISLGFNTVASGFSATSLGELTLAEGEASTSMGNNTMASGNFSTSMGNLTVANGLAATSMGSNTLASGNASAAMGMGTKAKSNNSLAIGIFNDGNAGPDDRLFEVGNGTADNARKNAFTVLSNGQAGMGTSRPGYPYVSTNKIFEIYNSNLGDGRSTIILSDSTNSGSMGGIIWKSKGIPLSEGLMASINTTMEYSGFPAYPKGAMHFSTSDQNQLVERITISALGNIGIGNTLPNAPLQLSNFVANRKIVLLESNNNDHQFMGFGTSSSFLRYQVHSTATDHVFFAATGAATSQELMRIKGNGSVGIGTSTPSQALQVVGNIIASGTITPSDARYKKNIAPITDPLQKLEQLNGVTYNYRPEDFPDMKFSDKQQVGLIAQDVEKIFPQLVFEDDKGYKGVDYAKLVPLLIEAIKLQQLQMEKQEKEIAELKRKTEKL